MKYENIFTRTWKLRTTKVKESRLHLLNMTINTFQYKEGYLRGLMNATNILIQSHKLKFDHLKWGQVVKPPHQILQWELVDKPDTSIRIFVSL